MKKNVEKSFVKKSFLTLLLLLLACIFACGCTEQTEVLVDGIEISKKNIYLAEGQTAVISAQVYPFNATNQNYTFESSNPNVVTVEDGFVCAKHAGDAIIYVYSDEGGYKDSCNVLVTTVENNLSLNDYNNLNMPPKDLQPIYNNDDYSNAESATNNPSVEKQNVSKTQKIGKKLAKNALKMQKNTQKTSNLSKTQKTTAKNMPPTKLKNSTIDKSNNAKKLATKTANKNGAQTPQVKQTTSKSTSPLTSTKPLKNANKKSIAESIKKLSKQVNAEVCDDAQACKNVIDEFKAELQNSIESIEAQKDMFQELWQDETFGFVSAVKNTYNSIFDEIESMQSNILQSLDEISSIANDGNYTIETKNIDGVTFVVIKNLPKSQSDDTANT